MWPPADEIKGVALREERNSKNGYLVIQSTFDLEPYDSYLSGAATTRPQVLVVLGILSYFTGEPFTVFQNFRGGNEDTLQLKFTWLTSWEVR